jgi:hypothetical protein
VLLPTLARPITGSTPTPRYSARSGSGSSKKLMILSSSASRPMSGYGHGLYGPRALSNKAQGRQEGGNTRGAIGQWTGASIIQRLFRNQTSSTIVLLPLLPRGCCSSSSSSLSLYPDSLSSVLPRTF